MTTWQSALLDALVLDLPSARIEPYGSTLNRAMLDGWSDLDVVITTSSPVAVGRLLRAEVWAYQSTIEPEAHVIRAVLVDGRRIDLTIRGTVAALPKPASDNDIRFDMALAAAKLGRGGDLIGLHLCLGVIMQTLVLRMEDRDRETGRTHHREATEQDLESRELLRTLLESVGPSTALKVYVAYGASRAHVDPGYTPDPRGLEALIRLGHATGDLDGSPTAGTRSAA